MLPAPGGRSRAPPAWTASEVGGARHEVAHWPWIDWGRWWRCGMKTDVRSTSGLCRRAHGPRARLLALALAWSCASPSAAAAGLGEPGRQGCRCGGWGPPCVRRRIPTQLDALKKAVEERQGAAAGLQARKSPARTTSPTRTPSPAAGRRPRLCTVRGGAWTVVIMASFSRPCRPPPRPSVTRTPRARSWCGPDDGNPATWEGTDRLRSYKTGEEMEL